MDKTARSRRRFRFSLRTLMVLVTLLSVAIIGIVQTYRWLERRRETFERLYEENSHQVARKFTTPAIFSDTEFKQLLKAHGEWCDAVDEHRYKLRDKYDYARKHPWAFVEPDPPEPPCPWVFQEDMIEYLRRLDTDDISQADVDGK